MVDKKDDDARPEGWRAEWRNPKKRTREAVVLQLKTGPAEPLPAPAELKAEGLRTLLRCVRGEVEATTALVAAARALAGLEAPDTDGELEAVTDQELAALIKQVRGKAK